MNRISWIMSFNKNILNQLIITGQQILIKTNVHKFIEWIRIELLSIAPGKYFGERICGWWILRNTPPKENTHSWIYFANSESDDSNYFILLIYKKNWWLKVKERECTIYFFPFLTTMIISLYTANILIENMWTNYFMSTS